MDGGGGGGGGVGILRDFFVHCKVEIFFFPSLYMLFFWPESVGIYFFINNFLGKSLFLLLPHLPIIHSLSNGVVGETMN